MTLSKFAGVSCISRVLSFLACLGLVFAPGCALRADATTAGLPGTTNASLSLPSRPDRQEFRYRLAPAPLREAPTQQRDPPPFRLLAPFSERARIVDKDGNVIRLAAGDGSIGRLEVSPDQQWVLLYFGDSKYSVASAESLEDMVRLPVQPDGFDDATGFRWVILDDGHLLGQADLPALETEGLTASEKESLLPRGTLIYVYAISSKAMTPVEVDGTLPLVFNIIEASDGNVTLLTLSSDERVGAKIVRTTGL